MPGGQPWMGGGGGRERGAGGIDRCINPENIIAVAVGYARETAFIECECPLDMVLTKV